MVLHYKGFDTAKEICDWVNKNKVKPISIVVSTSQVFMGQSMGFGRILLFFEEDR